MLNSAEVRWFWRDMLAPGLESWFRSGKPDAGGGTPRTDEYLVDDRQRELGMKKRAGTSGIEIKGLVAVRPPLPEPFSARVQIWTKWTSQALTIDHLPRKVVRKTRWLRKYDTGGSDIRELALDADERLRDSLAAPEHGCQLELVALTIDGSADRWWSVGFEAFGTLDTVEDSLRRTIAFVRPLAGEALAGGLELSYPDWLSATPRR